MDIENAIEDVGHAGGNEGPLLHTLNGYLLRRASVRSMSQLRDALRPLRLRPVLFSILELVRAQPGIIQIQVGTELGLPRPNLVPIMSQLIAEGWIRRTTASHDRRALSLFLTPSGEKILREGTKIVRQHEGRIVSRLTASEQRTFANLLRKVAIDPAEGA